TAWRRGWENGYGGRFADTHMNNINFNNFNVHNRWNDNVRVNRNYALNRQAGFVNSQRTVNNVVAGHDNQVYRPAGSNWERYGNAGWDRVDANRLSTTERADYNRLNADWSARRAGEANYQSYHAASG